jgi:4a-hydroxytetrahydrobiopterin dehydratase
MTLENWQQTTAGKLRREFRFPDFVEAFGFLTRVALAAEKLGHHPDIHSSYNRVELELFTHDKGALTELDYKLAEMIDGLVK